MKKIGTIIIITLFVIIESAMAYKYEKNKVIEKVFSCKEGVELSVLNKYGNITVNTWNKDEIKIKSIIVVQANKDVIDEILGNIDIRFSQEPNELNIETHVEIMQLWRFGKKKKDFVDIISLIETSPNMYKSGDKMFSYSVTYEILVPKYVDMNMKNSFGGDLYIHDCIGKITSDSKEGNVLLSNTNSPNVKINTSHGGIHIKNCGGNTENIDVTSTSGNITIDGYYDNLKIGTNKGKVDVQNRKLGIGRTSILSRYGNVTLNGYSKEIVIDTYNGNVKVNGSFNAENTNIKNEHGSTVFIGKSKTIMIESYNGYVDVANESMLGNINIVNKHGSIKYLGRFEEIRLSSYTADINVENRGVSGEKVTIVTKFGNIKYLGYAKNISLQNYNGNIDVGNETSPQIENLIVASAYGRVNLNNIENINIRTSNDTYNIQNSNSITIDDAKYTSFNVSGLKESFITMNQIKFGKINIRKIDPNFKKIQISNHYSTISLYFRQLNKNKIDISGKFGKFKIGGDFDKELRVIKETSSFMIKKEGTAGSITIDNQYGNIVLDTE